MVDLMGDSGGLGRDQRKTECWVLVIIEMACQKRPYARICCFKSERARKMPLAGF